MDAIYYNPKIGRWLDVANHDGCKTAWHIGPELIGYAQKQVGSQEVEVGEDENHLPIYEQVPVYEDDLGKPLYGEVDRYEVRAWNPDWGSLPTEEFLVTWDPPPVQNPVTDVEIMAKLFAEAQAAAPAYLNQLKGTVWAALVAGGMSQAEATAAGVALVIRHAAPLAAFEAAGGHPDAAAALYAAIASEASVAALPWLTAPILGLFSAALTPGK